MTYVRIDPKGTRLGNWMFQYAAARCAAPEDEVTFVVEDPADWSAVEKYEALFPVAAILSAAPQGATVRTDLYQDAQYLDRTLARSIYTCPSDLADRLTAKYGELLSSGEWVSIHVRRGDYLRLPHRHPFVGTRYLHAAVARFPTAKFLVCSDDLAWCKKFFRGDRFIFAEDNGVLGDLFLMTRCRGGHICSNSTFSWWGAYLGEQRPDGSEALTIFPSHWYGPALRDTDWHGLYFAGSEVITNRYALGQALHAALLMAKAEIGQLARKLGVRR